MTESIFSLENQLKRIENDRDRNAAEFANKADALAHEAAQITAKLEEAKAKRERAVERLRQQLSTASTDEIVEQLLSKGITCLTGEHITAADIIRESAELFEQSFWVAGAEVRTEVTGDTAEEVESYAEDQELEKYKVLPLSGGNWGAVTGLCSVGAIGLVRALRLKDEKQTDHITGWDFETLYGSDWATRIATEAVAREMREASNYEYDSYRMSARDAIIKLNDHHFTKDQVIECFRNALSSPLLDATELWSVDHPSCGTVSGMMFGTEQEAQAFIEEITAGESQDDNYHGPAYVLHHVYQMTSDWQTERVVTQEAYESRSLDLVDA